MTILFYMEIIGVLTPAHITIYCNWCPSLLKYLKCYFQEIYSASVFVERQRCFLLKLPHRQNQRVVFIIYVYISFYLNVRYGSPHYTWCFKSTTNRKGGFVAVRLMRPKVKSQIHNWGIGENRVNKGGCTYQWHSTLYMGPASYRRCKQGSLQMNRSFTHCYRVWQPPNYRYTDQQLRDFSLNTKD